MNSSTVIGLPRAVGHFSVTVALLMVTTKAVNPALGYAPSAKLGRRHQLEYGDDRFHRQACFR
ncbi:hypothetical protein QWZ16_21920 [Vibrio ostreicida]|uniref:DUF3265 domain-containing protein n=1 Tax=Vibrio ostreicida TaxID=526588 RepID=A0ABT8BXL2_9VIBR|nr:hypothetical protein [Vibrio ostreicida]MDN3611136.1 hypothetical protein [Vibrio ostreicida]MDN3612256.1 hypothetical protein [Vibrio ostreicida]